MGDSQANMTAVLVDMISDRVDACVLALPLKSHVNIKFIVPTSRPGTLLEMVPMSWEMQARRYRGLHAHEINLYSLGSPPTINELWKLGGVLQWRCYSMHQMYLLRRFDRLNRSHAPRCKTPVHLGCRPCRIPSSALYGSVAPATWM